MAATGVVLALLLQAGIVVAAVAGLTRVAGLRAFADDARLRRLSWFFALFAAAVGVQVLVSTFLLGESPVDRVALLRPLATLVLLHHALMLAALLVALRTFAVPWHPAAIAPAFLLIGHNGHYALLGLVEALLTLYLAVAAAANQHRRKTTGSLRVAAGFLLLFVGHLLFFLLLHHDGPRPFWGEGLTLAGVLLIVSSVPRRLGETVPAPPGSV